MGDFIFMNQTKNNYAELLRDPQWDQKRKAILKRDKHSCRVCYSKNVELHVHHLAYQGKPWEVPDHWLVTLCSNCHESEEVMLTLTIPQTIQDLRETGFTSASFSMLASVFSEYRQVNDSLKLVLAVLTHVVRSQSAWDAAYKSFIEKKPESRGYPSKSPLDILKEQIAKKKATEGEE